MEIEYDSFSWKDVYLYWQLKTNDLLNCVFLMKGYRGLQN